MNEWRLIVSIKTKKYFHVFFSTRWNIKVGSAIIIYVDFYLDFKFIALNL